MDIAGLQRALEESGLDGWLLYDFHGQNPTALEALGLGGHMLTRRWFYLVPRAGDPTLLTVTVTPGGNPTSTGLSVSADLSALGGAASQAFYDDGTHGDATSGDNVFSYSTTVPAATTIGAKSLAFMVSDAQFRTGGGSIALMVAPAPIAIHEIQGAGFSSPFANQVVTTVGVVTARRFNNGFFIQTPDAMADADPNTSEGVFVFTSSAPPSAS